MILRIFANCKIKRKLHIDQALCFYEHIGFYPIGTHRFFMGRDNRTDYLIRKDLQSPALEKQQKRSIIKAVNPSGVS